MDNDKEIQDIIKGVNEITVIQKNKSVEQIAKESQEAFLKQKENKRQ